VFFNELDRIADAEEFVPLDGLLCLRLKYCLASIVEGDLFGIDFVSYDFGITVSVP